MKSDKKQVLADIIFFWFGLVYHSEMKRENSNRGQKMSAKVCQRFLYSLPTLDPDVYRSPTRNIREEICKIQFYAYSKSTV
jgi:hypothetical protein